ncbi:slipin family protein [Flexithrix dorotheae]|uniref:slipin family protein n=1 Tax=Flexithrix dorotheae TaxID=70993 RepID=UPI0003614455|nr:slipin family protein [Flexithrix dorotheae]
MKRVSVNVGKVGLVFKNGDYQRVIKSGKHWLNFGEKVELFDLFTSFKSPIEIDLLLQDEELAAMLNLVEINDNEIALVSERGLFRWVLTPGRYAFWKEGKAYDFQIIDLNEKEISPNIPRKILQNKAVIPFTRVFVVESYEEGMLFEDGKFVKMLEKGTYHFWNTPKPLAMLKADMRQQQIEVSGQELLTRDKAALRINFQTKYQVTDIEKALIDNKDFERQLYIMMQMALREYISRYSLDELMENKEAVAAKLLIEVAAKADTLGVKILDCGIRDIILPGEVKDIMNQVLVAQKRAQANIITRREETASTRSLLNTAKLMEDNQMLFKLKEMEYMEKIAEKIDNISVSGGNKVVEDLRKLFG